MKFTKKGEYALRTLIQLGIAQNYGHDVLSVTALAQSENLPIKFVESILQELRRHGYVSSKRGKTGGCRLARPMKEITMGEVVRLIDGRLAPIGCASETDYERCSCPDEEHCGLRMLMIDVRNAIARILDKYTLQDVVSVTLQKMKRSGIAPAFTIAAEVKPKKRGAPLIKPLRTLHANPVDGLLSLLGVEKTSRRSRS